MTRRTWFVGSPEGFDSSGARPGDRIVPLNAMAASVVGGELEPARLREAERGAAEQVLGDLRRMVAALAADSRSRATLRFRDHDLAPGFRRPDEAVTGFPGQQVAYMIARSALDAGRPLGWGVNKYQQRGLVAALGDRLRWLGPSADAAARRRPHSLGSAAASEKHIDVLYLAIEPHVAQQHDRVLAALGTKYRIQVVVPQRHAWPWPADARFQPKRVRTLRSYLGPSALGRLALAYCRGLRAWRVVEPTCVPWMPTSDLRAWLASQWLRNASAAQAIAVALRHHGARLLIGANLASGSGCVMTHAAAGAGARVLSLPSGSDYLLPPSFPAGETGQAYFAVPDERIRRSLIDAGADATRLVTCGWPELDALLEATPRESREALMLRLGLDPSRPLVTFFSSPSSGADAFVVPAAAKRRALRALVAACEQAGAALAIKAHPREQDPTVSAMAASSGRVVPVVRDDLGTILHATDVVASLGSAVGFAAATLGKPVLLLDFGMLPNLTGPLIGLGIGRAPDSPEDLPEVLQELLVRPPESGARAPREPQGSTTAGRVASLIDRILADA